MDPSQTERIRLTVPATASAARITRAGAAALAARAGFTYREVDEVRLAVAEATSLLTAGHAGDESGEHARGETGDSRLQVTYALGQDGLRIELRLADAPTAVTPSDVDTAVLDASVDRWWLTDDGRGVVLLKQLPEADDEPDDD
ncbi:MAG TPA: ATP-binding protein [Acidimicrobiales bacterium]|nr:ATP-binding protein [Acidimicrobiales bacterium]